MASCEGSAPPRAIPTLRALVMASLAVAGCAQERTERPPNLILISVDALRADRLEAYGYPRPTSPFLAELGRSGLVFEHAFVNTHGTTPSHTTILSGLYQETHGVGLGGGDGGVVASRIPDDVPLVGELLQAHGYTTIGVTDRGNAGAAFGFARGFDHFDDRGGGIRRELPRLLELVAAAPATAPVFVFLHTYEVHSPYRPPEPQRTLLGVPPEAPPVSSKFLLEHANTALTSLPPGALPRISLLYDAGIRVVDDALRDLFARLGELGFLEHAVAIVTSDHGEELGEHGGLLHRDLLYDELVRVPLLVRGEGIVPGRPQELVSSIDIAPTLLALAGVPRPPALEGASLLEHRRRRAVISQYGDTRYAIRTRDWKLIWSRPGTLELFDLAADPGERRNLAQERPQAREALERALERWRDRHRPRPRGGPPVELDADAWRELESLGYLR